MNLEYLITLASFVLAVGFVGLMVRKETFAVVSSVVLIAGSVVTALAGFSAFWMNNEGASALLIVPVLLLVQIVTTVNLVGRKT